MRCKHDISIKPNYQKKKKQNNHFVPIVIEALGEIVL